MISRNDIRKMRNHFQLKLSIICCLLSFVEINGYQGLQQEVNVLEECLASYGGYNWDNVQRLQRYKEWSSTYEELPCFTRCYLKRMWNIYDESSGFLAENVIKVFGQAVYNACKSHFDYSAGNLKSDEGGEGNKGLNNCTSAYRGFHCLVKMEDNGFLYLESLKNISTEARSAMKKCLTIYPEQERRLLKMYSRYPVQEPIRCYTRCFVDKLRLFDYHFRQWNMAALHHHLDIPAPHANVEHCGSLIPYRQQEPCEWLYTEFTCFSLAT